jgi:hypothetical protein
VTEHRGNRLVSTLKIARADLRHAGKFTCAPSYAKPDTVMLHVVDGEFSSMQFIYPLLFDNEK